MQLSTINLSITRAYGGGVAAFSPTSLFANGEQGAWYDPSDLSTMFQDSAGTTPVTSVGQPVGLILDKSGNDNHASQATAAWRPLLQNDGVNNYLAFDGVDDALETVSMDKTSWTGGMAVYGSYPETGSAGCVLAGVSSATTSHEPYSDNQWYVSFGSPVRSDAIKSIAYGTKNILTRLHNTGVSSYRHDGALVHTASPSTTDFNGVSQLYMGKDPISVEFSGRIYSMIVLGRLATTEEIDQTEAWVAERTGVVLP